MVRNKTANVIALVVAIALLAVLVVGHVQTNRAQVKLEVTSDGFDHIGKGVAQKVQTKSGVTVLHASDWAEQYPEVYASFMRNQENDEVEDYLQSYPQLVTLYEPYGFSKSYGSARGHFYDVEDILATGRPHNYAQCWTCKTPDFTNLANEVGNEVYKYEFDAVKEQIIEGISCYNCHANTPGKVTVTHTYVVDALGDDWDKVPAADLACGQCHVEYYFAVADGATTLARHDLEGIHPSAILSEFNNNILMDDGQNFADYTNPRTGVRQIKVQHPEFETYLGEGTVHGWGRGDIAPQFTCADCHMGTVVGEDGKTYPNHFLTSPLDNQELIDSTCSKCHDDLAGKVHQIQEEVDTRTTAVSDQLVELTETLAAAVESGSYSEEELNAVRAVARDAQFYWDFVFVENAEGVHNSALTRECLDMAEALTAEAMGMLKTA